MNLCTYYTRTSTYKNIICSVPAQVSLWFSFNLSLYIRCMHVYHATPHIALCSVYLSFFHMFSQPFSSFFLSSLFCNLIQLVDCCDDCLVHSTLAKSPVELIGISIVSATVIPWLLLTGTPPQSSTHINMYTIIRASIRSSSRPKVSPLKHAMPMQ